MAAPNLFGASGKSAAKTATAAPLKRPAGATVQPVDKQATNHALFVSTVNAVRGGKLTESQASTVLSAAGFPDSDNPFTNRDAPGVGGVAHAVAVPLGLSRSHNIATAARANAIALSQGTAPPLGAGTVGTGTGFIGQALSALGQEAVNSPGGGVAFAQHPVRTSQRIVKAVSESVTNPLTPAHIVNDILLGSALVGGVGAGVARGVAAKGAIREGLGARAAVTRSAAEGGSLLHSPHPGTATIYVPGKAPAGGGAGPHELGGVVSRPLSRNVAVREIIQKPRAARIQAKVAEAPRSPKTKAGRAVRRTFAAQTTVGRETRAAYRVQNAKDAALRNRASHAIHRLDGPEHTALSVAAVEGSVAFTDPAGAVSRHIGTHEHFAAVGGDETGAHALRTGDLKAAQAVLEKPTPRFLKALALTRQTSQETEGRLIAAGHLEPATAQGRKDAIAQIYGNAQADPEAFYFPLSKRYTHGPEPSVPGAYSPSPSAYGQGPPAQTIQGLHKEFTGESVAQGLIPQNTGATITDRSARVDRLLQAERSYANLWKIATPAKRSVYDIPIRDTKAIKDELRLFFHNLADALHASPDAALGLSQDELAALLSRIELKVDPGLGVGTKIPGAKWVDSRYLADLGETTVKGPIYSMLDAINNPIRTVDLYLRPAYILNLAGNLGMAGVTQGLHVVPSLRRAVLANSRDGHENVGIIDSLLGSSLSRSYSVDTGFLGNANHQLAEGWNAITDLYVRRSAFYHEAAQAGFRSPSEIHELLHAPRNTAKLEEVTRRANKNLVDYGSLTPLERNTIRRAIFFYPWVSRGTIWALRTMVENPGKTFTLAMLGQIGAEDAHKRLGEQASWEKQLGLIPVGPRQGDLQGVLNPSSVWTPTTAVQAGYTLADTAKGLLGLPHTGALGQTFTPGLTLATNVAAQGTQTGKGGIPGLVESTPFYRAAVAAGLIGSPSKTYPDTGVGAALGPLAIGGFAKRNINTEQTRKQAYRATTDKVAKVASDLQRLRDLNLITGPNAAQILRQAKRMSPAEVDHALSVLGTYISNADKAGVTPGG